jgi:hypothetical protein
MQVNADCSAFTSRSAPYQLSAPRFEALHPEEADWVEARLDKTADAVS